MQITRVPTASLPHQAYAMAKASRSPLSVTEALASITETGSKRFFKRNYADYGHASIADLAHLPMGIEDLSILAAMHLVHQPLWDGQERSTRFQGMETSDWYNPFPDTDDPGTGLAPQVAFNATMVTAMANYTQVVEATYQCLADAYPDGSPATLRSRARDVGRLLIPLAIKTGVNQVLSARSLCYQIARLRAEEARQTLPELGKLANDLEDFGETWVPSLVRHTTPLWWEAQAAPDWGAEMAPAYPAATAELAGIRQPTSEMGIPVIPNSLWHALWVFATVPNAGTLRFILSWAGATSRRTAVADMVAQMPEYATLPWWFRTGPVLFDCALDIGSYRDMQRHRRMLAIMEPLAPSESTLFNVMPDWYVASTCLGKAGDAWLKEVGPLYSMHGMWLCQQASGQATPYLLPLGTVVRAVFSMDWEEASYVVKLRSRAPGHGLYRALARGMAASLIGYQHIDYGTRRTLPIAQRLLATTPVADTDVLARV